MRLQLFLLGFIGCSLAAECPGASPPLEQIILAGAKPRATPHFNGPRVVGVRVGTPFEALAVTGDRPLTYTAVALPAGLKLDAWTGVITGQLDRAGEHWVTVRAANAAGQAKAKLRIVVGETLALTPPLGWNSYNVYGDGINEEEFLASAAWFKEHLQPYGYDTVVIDFRWWDPEARTGQACRNMKGTVKDVTDQFGRLQPALNRFPSARNSQGFQPVAEKIHALGLKFGIHIMRGIPRYAVKANKPISGSSFTSADAVLPEGDPNRLCPWCVDMFGVRGETPAGEAWYRSIVEQYAGWGVDFIKADDMSSLDSYKAGVPGSVAYAGPEIAALQKAIRAARSIVLSLSPGATPLAEAPHASRNANLWRISDDFWDEWKPLDQGLSRLLEWAGSGASGPGHWPDGDMLPVGVLSLGGSPVGAERSTRYTPAEQLTLLTAWCMAPSPLMIGACLLRCDAWTEALLTNPEMLAVNQDSLGQPVHRLSGSANQPEVWIRALSDGAVAVAVFNRTDSPQRARLTTGQFNRGSKPKLRDIWLHRDLGRQESFTCELPPHGCVMLRAK